MQLTLQLKRTSAEKLWTKCRHLTSSGNCCLDKGVQLLITTDGQLQVAGSDTLHL